MTAKEYQTITVEEIDKVRRVTLNRPEKRNALSLTLQNELLEAIVAAERDRTARVVVIRGAGPAFSAGYDVAAKDSADYIEIGTPAEDVAQMQALGRNWSRILTSSVPVIAQIHGHCLAGGTDLALNCDILIAADDAQIGFPAVRSQGSPPTHMWLYHVGPQRAKRLLLTGDSLTGKEAADVGLVLESVPAAELDAHVLKLASRIANIGSDLLAHNKRIVNLGLDLMGRDTLQQLAGIHDVLAHSAPERHEFNEQVREHGFRSARLARDAAFD